jgi:YVTN family beta-propeller protein
VLAATPLYGQSRLYLTNQDDATVTIINLDTRQLVETLDLQKMGFGPNAKPHHAQVEPDGAFWYVTLIGAGKVLKLDRENRIVGSVDLEVPGLLSLDPARDRLVVARSMSAVNPPRRMAIIRRSDMKLLDEVDVFFPRPHPLALDPRGNVAYVGSLGVNQMASVRLEDGEVKLLDIEGPYHTLTQFAISPDAKWLVATGSTSSQLLVFDIAKEGAPRLARTVPVEKGPFETVFSADGKKLFVTNLDANVVSVVDVATWTPGTVIRGDVFQQPHGAALSPDGQRVWVSNRHQSGGAHDHEGHKATGSGSAVAICVATATVDTAVPAGHYAAGIGIPSPSGSVPIPRPCR